ncbi:MAG: Na+/H+ antiporter NhaC family protein [Breznakibacter sp.]
MMMKRGDGSQKKGFWALLPLVVFLVVYLVTSLVAGDFYKMPITVAFLVSGVVGVAITRGLTLHKRIDVFVKGAANQNILYMVLIFIFAGAFAVCAKSMGAVDATVNLILSITPDSLLMAGVFVAACLISLAVGTSVGTIVALMPVVIGLADKTGLSQAMMTGVVIGGAMFGDNLSFISDTTIVAVRTQGCAMKDKFYANLKIVFPVAMVVMVIYLIVGFLSHGVEAAPLPIEWIKVVPYFLVLVGAAMGMNVLLVLFMGILLTGLSSLLAGGFDVWVWLNAMNDGVSGMGELIVISLLAGGILEMIRYNGGIDWLIQKLTARVDSKQGAEYSISALVCLANICTANNTIALVMSGPIARDISLRFGIDPRRSASLLDTFSCFVQGILPYGAQVLMAAGLSGLSPLEIIPYLFYPMLMGLGAFLAILFRYPRSLA